MTLLFSARTPPSPPPHTHPSPSLKKKYLSVKKAMLAVSGSEWIIVAFRNREINFRPCPPISQLARGKKTRVLGKHRVTQTAMIVCSMFCASFILVALQGHPSRCPSPVGVPTERCDARTTRVNVGQSPTINWCHSGKSLCLGMHFSNFLIVVHTV